LLAAVLQKPFNTSDPTNHLSVHRLSPPAGNLAKIQAGLAGLGFEELAIALGILKTQLIGNFINGQIGG